MSIQQFFFANVSLVAMLTRYQWQFNFPGIGMDGIGMYAGLNSFHARKRARLPERLESYGAFGL
jgi:hypothetical protein